MQLVYISTEKHIYLDEVWRRETLNGKVLAAVGKEAQGEIQGSGK
jgi:hypothetical protein